MLKIVRGKTGRKESLPASMPEVETRNRGKASILQQQAARSTDYKLRSAWDAAKASKQGEKKKNKRAVVDSLWVAK